MWLYLLIILLNGKKGIEFDDLDLNDLDPDDLDLSGGDLYLNRI